MMPIRKWGARKKHRWRNMINMVTETFGSGFLEIFTGRWNLNT